MTGLRVHGFHRLSDFWSGPKVTKRPPGTFSRVSGVKRLQKRRLGQIIQTSPKKKPPLNFRNIGLKEAAVYYGNSKMDIGCFK